MLTLINLRQARKQKAKADQEKTAAANRVLHGTPKALRKLTDAQKDQAATRLSAHKLEKPGDDHTVRSPTEP